MPVIMEKMLIYEISNGVGMRARVLNYGASLTHLWVPDAKGRVHDVLLGYDRPQDYLRKDNPYFNCTIGRYANRIANSRFHRNGGKYELENPGQKHLLHSGTMGFDKKYWELISVEADSIVLQHTSPDGEGGFPGELTTRLTYRLTKDNTLQIRYLHICDQDCPVGFTFHGYFNLGGEDLLSHRLWVDAPHYLEVDDELIPTGALKAVEHTAFDLRAGVNLGDLFSKGIYLDHCFASGVVNQIHRKARLQGSYLGMEVHSNMPGVQVYTGNGLNTDIKEVKNPHGYLPYTGICLEAQYYPDAPNHSSFPSPWLAAHSEREDIIEYRFCAL